jgi:ribose 5-phosphate isomerase B
MVSFIFIGSDHAGFGMKSAVIEWIKGEYSFEYKKSHNIDLVISDEGTYSKNSCDYPDFAHSVCKLVIEYNKLSNPSQPENDAIGIVICGTGIGMSIVCNRYQNIRCALCHNTELAIMTRKHNDANVLSLGARVTDIETTIEIIKSFIETKFDGGRHSTRVSKINTPYTNSFPSIH